jgi:hypothetical protein
MGQVQTSYSGEKTGWHFLAATQRFSQIQHRFKQGQRPGHIPAWGNAPGMDGITKARAESTSHSQVPTPNVVWNPSDGSGLQPLMRRVTAYLGRCPRLVCCRAVGALLRRCDRGALRFLFQKSAKRTFGNLPYNPAENKKSEADRQLLFHPCYKIAIVMDGCTEVKRNL